MNKMESSAERSPQTGIDRVAERLLYGLMQFPQADFTSDAYAYEAIFADPNPISLIETYLETPLSDELAVRMLEKANRAHAAYLPKERVPDIKASSMQRIWDAGRYKLQEALLYLLDEPYELDPRPFDEDPDFEEQRIRITNALKHKRLPLPELRAVSKMVLETLKQEPYKEALAQYRDRFRGEHWEYDEFDQPRELQWAVKQIWKPVMKEVRERVASATLDATALERCLEIYEGLEGGD